MTRMTKDETKLLAQAAVIVDSLLPWKKLSATFDKKQLPKTIEPEHSLLDAAALSMPTFISDLPTKENPVVEALKKVKAMDYSSDYATPFSAWFKDKEEYQDHDINATISTLATVYKKQYNDYYQSLHYNSAALGKFSDSALDYFSAATITPPKNVNRAKCKDIFQRAYSVIRRPELWTQGEYSRTVTTPKTYAFYQPPNPMIQDDGTSEVKIERKVYTNYETHRQFCSAGAILHADGVLLDQQDGRRARSLSPEALFVGGQLNKFMHNSIAKFNDSRTHNEVVKAWEQCGAANGWL